MIQLMDRRRFMAASLAAGSIAMCGCSPSELSQPKINGPEFTGRVAPFELDETTVAALQDGM
jgi:hypothetical protein